MIVRVNLFLVSVDTFFELLHFKHLKQRFSSHTVITVDTLQVEEARVVHEHLDHKEDKCKEEEENNDKAPGISHDLFSVIIVRSSNIRS